MHKFLTSPVLAMSFVALLGVHPAGASSMPMAAPLTSWNVGKVNGAGGNPSYCAMVNRYSNGVTLAFARNTAGVGSIALDFQKSMLAPGLTYSIWLDVDGRLKRRFEAKATSHKSLIIQTGRDEALYNALTRNGRLDIAFSEEDVSFALSRFSNNFARLEDCTADLKTALPAPDLDRYKSNTVMGQWADQEGADQEGSENARLLPKRQVPVAPVEVEGGSGDVIDRKLAALDAERSELEGIRDLVDQQTAEQRLELEMARAEIVALKERHAEERGALETQQQALEEEIARLQSGGALSDDGLREKELELEARARVLAEKSARLEQQRLDLEERMTVEAEALARQRVKLEHMQAEIKNQNAEIELAQTRLIEREEELGLRIAKLVAGDDETKDLEQRKQDLEKHIAKLTQQRAELITSKESTRKQIARVRETLAKAQARIASLEDLAQRPQGELEERLIALQEKIQRQEEGAERRVASLDVRESALMQQRKELDAALSEKSNLVEKERKALQEAQQEIARLKEEKERDRQRFAQMQDRLELRVAELEASGAPSDVDLARKRLDLEKRAREQSEEYTRLESKYQELESLRQADQKRREKEAQLLAEARTEIERLKVAEKDITVRYKTAVARVQTLESELEEKTRRVAELEEGYGKLEAQYAGLIGLNDVADIARREMVQPVAVSSGPRLTAAPVVQRDSAAGGPEVLYKIDHFGPRPVDLDSLEPASGATMVIDASGVSLQDVAFVPLEGGDVGGGLPQNIRRLLKMAHIPVSEYLPSDGGVIGGSEQYRWVSGEVHGAYERINWPEERSFDSLVDDYMARFRQGCSGSLTVNVSQPRIVGGRHYAVADMICRGAVNTAGALLFYGENGQFSALLHEGDLSQRPAVVRLREDLRKVFDGA